MSFGSRLKERRESLNITQLQLAGLLGVSKGAIGNWETDVNSPRATLLYDLFDILKCDANYLFQDEMRNLRYKDKATPEEFENIIKKYRALDNHGQTIVNMVLEEEHKRCKKEITPAEGASEKMSEFPQHITKAAHARTDINATEEMNQCDDDIMNDESEWE